ncbi:hypothetical protein [Paenibacillus sp. NPDC058071]|uniref:hypothetical protein n=1 Tax=Paenibacillus sp. NPDC058071 TaxID=3346326 RepID=UPI0036DD35DF
MITLKKNGWKLIIGAVLLATAVSGCGGAGGSDKTDAQSGIQGEMPGQRRPEGGMAMNGTLGKIKSIDGKTMVIYQSSFSPGQRPEGGPDGEAPPRGGEQGQFRDRKQAPERAEGRDMPEEMFSNETMEVELSDSTTVTETSFANGERVEENRSIADLKEGDTVFVTLKEGTQQAEAIRIGGIGGFGGFGGGPRAGGNGNTGGK